MSDLICCYEDFVFNDLVERLDALHDNWGYNTALTWQKGYIYCPQCGKKVEVTA